MSDTPERTNSVAGLDFQSCNAESKETIILIHGSGTSGHDWDLVHPYIRRYHLLLPHLFTANSIKSARSVENLAGVSKPHWQTRYVDLLASLIRSQAKKGRAHIVGLSLGGCFAMALAAEHPELSLSLFVSGLPKLIQPPNRFLRPLAAIALWVCQRLVEMLGPENISRALDGQVRPHPGGWDGEGSMATVETQNILIDTIAGGLQIPKFDSERFLATQRQTGSSIFQFKIIAATRRNRFTPTADSTDWAVSVAKQFRNLKSVANKAQIPSHSSELVYTEVYEAKDMFHPWNRQDPELFSNCILATVQGLQLSSEKLALVWTSEHACD